MYSGKQNIVMTASERPNQALNYIERNSICSESSQSFTTAQEHNTHDIDVKKAHDFCSKAREKIREIRKETANLRSKVRESRAGLQTHRNIAGIAEARFMTAMRRLCKQRGHHDAKALSNLYDEVEAARNTLGDLQDDYNQEEEKLIIAEYELEEAELKYYDRYGKPEDHQGGTYVESSSMASWTDEEERALQPFLNSHPLAEEYMAELGRAEMAREEILELVGEREDCLEKQRFRLSREIPLYEADVDFLKNFPKLYSQSLDELQKVEMELSRLWQTAIEQGHPLPLIDNPEAAHIAMEVNRLRQIGIDQYVLLGPRFDSENTRRGSGLDKDSGSKTFEYDPSKETFVAIENNTSAPVIDTQSDSRSPLRKLEDINTWVLDTLAHTSPQRARHAANIEDDDSSEETQWSRNVMRRWEENVKTSTWPHDFEVIPVMDQPKIPVRPQRWRDSVSTLTTRLQEPSMGDLSGLGAGLADTLSSANIAPPPLSHSTSSSVLI
ncbi:hypothetical protein L228DRAFT_239666 [Xylona heveae TC161]|uniref:Uncharacterized protein n=1 Tax=Xylona heveae (strain CBS 132557 / TC161) TaxID=1328760 RepID=A0A165G444_XYLHT|nr:hypothetical protein L228DRAFT_239666 [Xylona heveae TC161]KZF21716.1 hypothetical protein L228DRAFT_239666 [Xylona heveae TC161]